MMKAKRVFGAMALAALSTGLVLTMSGCGGIPEGTTKDAAAGAVQLQATGAGIVKADAQKTTFRIKCARCGYLSDEMVIDTPAADKPYTQDWVCPKCGHKQKIVIRVVAPK